MAALQALLLMHVERVLLDGFSNNDFIGRLTTVALVLCPGARLPETVKNALVSRTFQNCALFQTRCTFGCELKVVIICKKCCANSNCASVRLRVPSAQISASQVFGSCYLFANCKRGNRAGVRPRSGVEQEVSQESIPWLAQLLPMTAILTAIAQTCG